jgi:hypothetical protein
MGASDVRRLPSHPMPLFQLRSPPNLDRARGDQDGRHVGMGAVLVVAMVASAVMWALVIRYLLTLWV